MRGAIARRGVASIVMGAFLLLRGPAGRIRSIPAERDRAPGGLHAGGRA